MCLKKKIYSKLLFLFPPQLSSVKNPDFPSTGGVFKIFMLSTFILIPDEFILFKELSKVKILGKVLVDRASYLSNLFLKVNCSRYCKVTVGRWIGSLACKSILELDIEGPEKKIWFERLFSSSSSIV